MNFATLYARYEESKRYKDNWLALYNDLYTFVIPNRDAFNIKFNFQDGGKPTGLQMWDNTALLSAYQRANDLHGLLLPQDRVWGKLSLDPRLVKEDHISELQPVIDEVNDRLFFYLNQSNLARMVASSNLDLVGGTAALWVESIDDVTPLYFRSIPAISLVIEYSTDDVLNTCWYQCRMSGRKIAEDFPKYKNKRRLLEEPSNLFVVIYGQIKLREDKFYIYAILEDDPFTPLWESERDYNQIIIYRDRVRPGECEGRGIGIDLLPTIRDLNRVIEYSRKNLAFKANPPLFYDVDKYFNPHMVRQWAGALIARNPNGRNPLEALQLPEYPEIIEHIRDLRQVIRDGFQVDPIGEINTPVKSATEVSIRENRAQRTSATDISRLINELPKQIFTISAKILAKRRLLSQDRSVSGINSHLLRFDFQSPLYDLQKQDDLSHFTMMAQILQQFGGEGAVLTATKMEEVLPFLADKLNLPSKLMKSKEEFAGFLQRMAQQIQQSQTPQLPSPSTSASPISIPSPSQVQF
ncbi:portal protein [Rickettsiella endosymbiont of Dermanyssus gallinae]|uniref:portal protein n=1 Tax=Rickettsiella endosymbiont of Dermanyssus gallinae TaxID=2856608 RepID=UPI001FE5E8D8|nr:portal protein [Rickettsiella endosymbiont of Dermanyssus gallinae]